MYFMVNGRRQINFIFPNMSVNLGLSMLLNAIS
jgi:hypothetical protein